MEQPKRTSNKKPVTAQNRNFESITEFCQEFGLKYSSVNAQLRKGYTGDEILEKAGTLPMGTRYSDTHSSAQQCSYNGVEYPSLVVAADSLGIPMDKVIAIKKEENLPINTAIARIMEEQLSVIEPNSSKIKAKKHVGEISIDGVIYKNMQEALLAYGMPYITVKSRMEREGISFEEALCRGKKERRHITPYLSNSLYKIIRSEQDLSVLCEQFVVPKDNKDIFAILSKQLMNNAYTVTTYYYQAAQVGMICFYEQLHAIRERRLIVLSFPYPQTFYPLNIEISIPNLLTVSTDNKEEHYVLLKKINNLQGKYLNASINLSNDKISVRWLYTLTSATINIRQFLITLHKFIGTAAAMFDELQPVLETKSVAD
jgi:hypothetical protein